MFYGWRKFLQSFFIDRWQVVLSWEKIFILFRFQEFYFRLYNLGVGKGYYLIWVNRSFFYSNFKLGLRDFSYLIVYINNFIYSLVNQESQFVVGQENIDLYRFYWYLGIWIWFFFEFIYF